MIFHLPRGHTEVTQHCFFNLLSWSFLTVLNFRLQPCAVYRLDCLPLSTVEDQKAAAPSLSSYSPLSLANTLGSTENRWEVVKVVEHIKDFSWSIPMKLDETWWSLFEKIVQNISKYMRDCLTFKPTGYQCADILHPRPHHHQPLRLSPSTREPPRPPNNE